MTVTSFMAPLLDDNQPHIALGFLAVGLIKARWNRRQLLQGDIFVRARVAGEEASPVLLGCSAASPLTRGLPVSHTLDGGTGKLIDEANKISATGSRGLALSILRRKAG